MALNKQQRLFADAFCGDTVEAMQIAGYQGDPNYLKSKGNTLLKNPDVMEIIKTRAKFAVRTQNAVATRDERMEFWTSIMKNKDEHANEEKDSSGIPIPKENVNIPMNMRLKASELLAKAEGDFIERVDFTGKVTISDVIQQSYKIEDKTIEAIEAEYMVLREEKRRKKAEAEEIEYNETEEEESSGIPEGLI